MTEESVTQSDALTYSGGKNRRGQLRHDQEASSPGARPYFWIFLFNVSIYAFNYFQSYNKKKYQKQVIEILIV